MKKFDTKIQLMKYKALREVARLAWDDNLLDFIMTIPNRLITSKKPTMRCCIYKERAVLGERVKLAMGGDKTNPNVIEVIDIACDECPVGGYEVTAACRGCLAHHCEETCKFGAIYFDHQQKAHIDKSKCVECGACSKACPYSAIRNYKRPCQEACKINAITMNEDNAALIDNDKCISCGACVYQCPFGAISDKSFILEAIELIKKSNNNTSYNVVAVIAPSISAQFKYASLSQVISGLYKLGFSSVVEAALGADMVALTESRELYEKGFATSSCCPAFVSYVEKYFPDMIDKVSHTLSPMAMIAKHLKEQDPTCKIIFIGPCTAKKVEYKKNTVKPFVDSVITFEELQALLDSKDIDITELSPTPINDASYYGRIFARSGGVSTAIKEAIEEQNIDFELKAVPCNGIEECRIALLKASKNVLDGNFIEGMACIGGCIGGAGCLTHNPRSRIDVDAHSKEAQGKTITEVVTKKQSN